MARFKSGCAALAVVVLGACGGGGGDSGSSNGGGLGGGTTSAPPASGAPTATLQSSANGASSLVTTAKASAAAVAKAGGLNGVPGLGLVISPPNGVTQSGNQACANGGSIALTATVTNANGPLTAGDTISIVASNCSQVAGTVVNGSLTITYTRYVSESDFAFDITANSLTEVSGGVTHGPYTLSAHYDIKNGVASYTYAVDGATVVTQPNVTYSGNNVAISSGTIHTNYGDGWVEVAFSNWQYDSTTGVPTSGTITVTASNGNRAVITVTSSGYNVSITVNGATTSYVVPFS